MGKSLKNILITGGAGFIGSNLAIKLINNGYNVTILDNLSPQVHGDDPEQMSFLYKKIKGNITFIRGTVTNRSHWETALRGQNIVVHLAAETGTGQSMYEIEKYVDVNVRGTSILLDILANKEHSIEKLVVASSRAIYGEGKYKCEEHGIVYPNERAEWLMDLRDFNCKCPFCNNNVESLPTSEDGIIHPSSIYGITKQVQEQLIMVGCKSIGISAVALRYQNVYGPGQSLSNPYTGILSIFSNQILNGENINIFEDGKESRDFIYIEDAVEATFLAIENQESNNRVFNVGTGNPVSVYLVAETLRKYYNSSSIINISGNYRLGDIRTNYADLKNVHEILGFRPKIEFEPGLKIFTDWVKEQIIPKSKYEDSIEEMKKRGLYK